MTGGYCLLNPFYIGEKSGIIIMKRVFLEFFGISTLLMCPK
jgi:hypothetical protein